MLVAGLLIVLALLAVLALPGWPYSRRWGYVPSGLAGAALVALLIVALTSFL